MFTNRNYADLLTNYKGFRGLKINMRLHIDLKLYVVATLYRTYSVPSNIGLSERARPIRNI